MGGTDYLDAPFTGDGGEEVLEVGETDAVERFVAEAVDHVVDVERVLRIDVHSVTLIAEIEELHAVREDVISVIYDQGGPLQEPVHDVEAFEDVERLWVEVDHVPAGEDAPLLKDDDVLVAFLLDSQGGREPSWSGAHDGGRLSSPVKVADARRRYRVVGTVAGVFRRISWVVVHVDSRPWFVSEPICGRGC
jgi:hypothetical protein